MYIYICILYNKIILFLFYLISKVQLFKLYLKYREGVGYLHFIKYLLNLYL